MSSYIRKSSGSNNRWYKHSFGLLYQRQQFHVVSKNSISGSVGMQQKYLINGIQHVGVSHSFSLIFSIMHSCLHTHTLITKRYVLGLEQISNYPWTKHPLYPDTHLMFIHVQVGKACKEAELERSWGTRKNVREKCRWCTCDELKITLSEIEEESISNTKNAEKTCCNNSQHIYSLM